MPILIHSLKLLYVRVPKTASTSFINALDHLNPKHIGAVHGNIQEAKHILEKEDKWNALLSYRHVGFIRHPYDWCRSAYAHWRVNPEMFPECKGATSLYNFVHKLSRTPVSWLVDETGRLVCETWRTEDMGKIMPRLGLEVLRKNVRASNDPKPIDDATKALICRKFVRVFRLGDYDA